LRFDRVTLPAQRLVVVAIPEQRVALPVRDRDYVIDAFRRRRPSGLLATNANRVFTPIA
jgi:hypothetical protein